MQQHAFSFKASSVHCAWEWSNNKLVNLLLRNLAPQMAHKPVQQSRKQELKVSLFRKQICAPQILPKKQMNKFGCFFDMKSKKAKKKNVPSFFGRIYDTPICFWFYLTFKRRAKSLVSYYVYCAIPTSPKTSQEDYTNAIWMKKKNNTLDLSLTKERMKNMNFDNIKPNRYPIWILRIR